MTTTVPVPLALRHLIESNNQLLENYRSELTSKVIVANEEMMRMMGLDPKDGWRLDIETFTYIKLENTDASSVSE
jgi:hypothetical protein